MTFIKGQKVVRRVTPDAHRVLSREIVSGPHRTSGDVIFSYLIKAGDGTHWLVPESELSLAEPQVGDQGRFDAAYTHSHKRVIVEINPNYVVVLTVSSRPPAYTLTPRGEFDQYWRPEPTS
jgi:hypothetical protein